MSMISSLIDELRKSADEWNRSNMFELARMCNEAADTIWELRDDLQRTNAENAKLRELLQRLLAEYRYMSVRPRKVYMQHERRMRAIENEMRELGVDA